MILPVKSAADDNLRCILTEMQSTGELCDFTIKSGAHSVRAHKCVLAATLEYFRTSFRFSESDTNETSIDLSHLNCEVSAIGKVVQSLYNNQVEVNQENVGSILRVADYLMHNELLCVVERFMEKTLDLSTAALYFQLCLQYGYNNTQVFRSVCMLVSSRWHDYLILQASSLDWSMDVMEAMRQYSLFGHATPLQMTAFMLKKIEQLIQQKHAYENSELDGILSSIFSFLVTYFSQLDRSALLKWCTKINQCLEAWKDADVTQNFHSTENIQSGLLKIQRSIALTKCELALKESDGNISSLEAVSSSNSPPDTLNIQNDHTDTRSQSVDKASTGATVFSNYVPSSTSDTNSSKFKEIQSQSSSPTANSKYISSADKSYDNDNQPESQAVSVKSESVQLSDTHVGIADISHRPDSETSSLRDDSCDSLVVLSPSDAMVSQLMVVEAGKARPLLSSPQLSLHFYDLDLNMWRSAGNLDFPVHGYMAEKHAWRMAFVHKSLFMFSLTKRKGLEYNMEARRWRSLECEDIFKPHPALELEGDDNDNDDNEAANRNNSLCFPVKSVIPVSMAGTLVVLSMSREARQDRSFWTQQHIYQWESERGVLEHVTCVRDARMDLPATKWTVDGDVLVTVKASAMMFGDLQMFNVQHVHEYNSRTRRLHTHHVNCPMKSGLKIFLQGKKLYLLNNFREYRVYDLVAKELSDWTTISSLSSYLHCGDPDIDIAYPAGIRISCHAGKSRWTLNSNFNVGSASLSEHQVSEGGEFVQKCHPNPPFQYMTSMCSSKLDRQLLDSLGQAVFHLPTPQQEQ